MKPLSTLGPEEEAAVLRVMRSKVLSGYLASSRLAGPEIMALEAEWAEFFKVNFAVACNSATSGLLAACMAIGVGPGDEVIVPFLTMSATACAPNVLGAQIVLADVDENFCIDPNHVGKLINENTKAVIATNLFGHPAKLHLLRSMCNAAKVTLIEDNAQAIMAEEDGKYTGTIGHIGVFSLNYHKQIQAGEGGVCVTDNVTLYERLINAINHGENLGSNFPGLNLRMTELTAAIAREQLKKLPDIIQQRTALTRRVQDIFSTDYYHGLINIVPTRIGCVNSHYAVPFMISDSYSVDTIIRYLTNKTGIPFSDYLHGNLRHLRISKKWTLEPQYREVRNLMLMETCSYDIQEDQLKKLEMKDDG